MGPKSITIPEHIIGLGVRHLQTPPTCTSYLYRIGIRTIGDVAEYTASPSQDLFTRFPDVRINLRLLCRHAENERIDWPAFWDEPEIDIHWLAMSFGKSHLDGEDLDRTLESIEDHFGTLLRVPRAHGIQTLGELIECLEVGSKPWRGYGAKKIRLLGTKLHSFSTGEEMLNRKFAPSSPSQMDWPEALLDEEIDILGLGSKTATLKYYGYSNLRSMLENPEGLFRVPSVGRRTIVLAKRRLALLDEALIDGELDLERLAKLQEVQIIPHGMSQAGDDLRRGLAELIYVVSEADKSEIAALIAEHRICAAGSSHATLDAISQMAPTRITRERVRQIERRVLSRVGKLLLASMPELGQPIVHPELKKRFKELTAALTGKMTISPAELGMLLAKLWGSSLREAFGALPMTMAIIEGTARSSAELRRIADSPEEFFRPLGPGLSDWPVQNVAAERGLSQWLKRQGLDTLEDLRGAWIIGWDFGAHEKYIFDVLSAACEASATVAEFPKLLSRATNRRIVPEDEQDWPEFIMAVESEVAQIIREGTFWSDAEQIFRERTAQLPNERPTIAALGSKLGRLGVAVKKTETETLARLASSILDLREGYSQTILRPSWLKKWRELKQIHDRFPDDQKTFRRSIEALFALEERSLTMAMPAIWAVLAGLPTRKVYGKSKAQAAALVLAPVKLSGFRTVH